MTALNNHSNINTLNSQSSVNTLNSHWNIHDDTNNSLNNESLTESNYIKSVSKPALLDLFKHNEINVFKTNPTTHTIIKKELSDNVLKGLI